MKGYLYKGAEMSKKTILLAAYLFFLSVLFFGAEDAPCRENKITITDARNRVVVVKQPVERIGFSCFFLASALKIIGAWDKIVARDSFVINNMFYPNIDKIPVSCITKDNPYDLDFEKLLELDVDCFFSVTGPYFHGFEEMNERIQSQITVVALDIFEPNTVKRNFEILDEICGKSNKATDFINWYENVVNKVKLHRQSRWLREGPWKGPLFNRSPGNLIAVYLPIPGALCTRGPLFRLTLPC
jgi:iron complex transport system substrate-binding protein